MEWFLMELQVSKEEFVTGFEQVRALRDQAVCEAPLTHLTLGRGEQPTVSSKSETDLAGDAVFRLNSILMKLEMPAESGSSRQLLLEQKREFEIEVSLLLKAPWCTICLFLIWCVFKVKTAAKLRKTQEKARWEAMQCHEKGHKQGARSKVVHDPAKELRRLEAIDAREQVGCVRREIHSETCIQWMDVHCFHQSALLDRIGTFTTRS